MRTVSTVAMLAGLTTIAMSGLFPARAEGQSFLRADANADGTVNVSDPIDTFEWLFAGRAAPPCLDAADSNDDGKANLADGIFTLCFLFSGGDAVPAPGVEVCGPDPTADDLDCERFAPCRQICGGIAGIPCGPDEFCDLPPGSCEGADFQGECVTVSDACPRNFDPVCGCNGVTYSNDCERIRARVSKDHDGPCRLPCGGIAGVPCDDGQICDLPPGECGAADLQGECVDRPEACLAVFEPVCGCDGVTYPNDCERLRAGASLDHDGPCAD